MKTKNNVITEEYLGTKLDAQHYHVIHKRVTLIIIKIFNDHIKTMPSLVQWWKAFNAYQSFKWMDKKPYSN